MNQGFFPDATITSGPVAPLAEGGTTADVEHPEGLLAGAGGAEIYWQAWLPSGEPRAVVVIAHGIGEHSGRYGHVAARLNAAGFAAYALDHRGHGRSSGPRGLIDRMDHAVSDVDSFVTLAAARHADHPSSAAASLGSAQASTRLEAWALAAVAPTAGVMEIDPSLISHDPAVVRSYREDPLVYQGQLPARTVAEVAATVEGFAAGVPALRVPLLVMAGTGDRIVPPSGSRMMYDRAGSPDRTLRLYDGLYHELFNEPERRVVLGDVTGWLDARTVPQHVEAQALGA